MDNQQLKIQDYLSIGYVYLLILGVLRDSMYYGFLGINIMTYSNITDVLLSPIAALIKYPILTVIMFFLTYWVFVQPSLHKNYREEKWYQKWFDVEKRDELYSKPNIIPKELPIVALVLASMLLGAGVGAGIKTSQLMEDQDLSQRDQLIFSEGDTARVRIVGQNSGYIFYVEEEADKVTVSPINGVIRSIERKSVTKLSSSIYSEESTYSAEDSMINSNVNFIYYLRFTSLS